MGSGHSHHHAEDNLKVAFFLNLGFTIIEIIGGLYTNSLAILSDALHDLGDSLSLGLSWYFQKISTKGRTDNFSYGFKRFSLLGALINSLILFAGSIFILVKAVPEILDPERTNTTGMMILACLGILVNGAAVLRLRKGHSLNEKVVSLHLMEDVLGWVAVLIGSILMKFFDLPWIDPLLSVLISIYILFNVVKNLKQSLYVLLQGVPAEVSVSQIKKILERQKEINDVHDIHLWSMDGEYNILTVHVRLDQNYDLFGQSAIKQSIRDSLKDLKIDHVTIEVDCPDEDCYLQDC